MHPVKFTIKQCKLCVSCSVCFIFFCDTRTVQLLSRPLKLLHKAAKLIVVPERDMTVTCKKVVPSLHLRIGPLSATEKVLLRLLTSVTRFALGKGRKDKASQ